ncbi:glutathione S-transferase 2-like isoform X2 [Rosa rugosa]|uniref:glutathione S-transferase 2-like isoform X2 n=1 Tax=Rosa rugosa TaxID=74645 RepID=UPI002B417978|nr:glutathione S-transferase 2-like isoform X2 [Rosa rugosa]
MASGSDKNGDQQLKLYSCYRSSCSFRVRIALNLKGLKYEYKAVNLLKGEQFSPEFRKLNPIGCVPVLVDGDLAVSDSFAILLYLEEKYPQHPLLPKDLQRKAINFQAANIVCSSIQPFQNQAVLNYIEEMVTPDAKIELAKVHTEKGFAGRFVFGAPDSCSFFMVQSRHGNCIFYTLSWSLFWPVSLV